MSNSDEIKKQVLEKIQRGDVSMRPRLFFVAQVVFIAMLSCIAAALAIFVLSFAFFSLHESGEQFLLGFGSRGLVTFLSLFPWMALLATALLFFVIEWLLRYFAFAYRVPVVRIFLVIFGIATLASVLINFTPLHSTLLGQAERDNLPIVGGMYEAIHDPHQKQGVFRGDVTSMTDTSFVISHNDNDRDTDDGTWNIIAPVGFDLTTLHVGDRVYIGGTIVGDHVRAYGIQVF